MFLTLGKGRAKLRSQLSVKRFSQQGPYPKGELLDIQKKKFLKELEIKFRREKFLNFDYKNLWRDLDKFKRPEDVLTLMNEQEELMSQIVSDKEKALLQMLAKHSKPDISRMVNSASQMTQIGKDFMEQKDAVIQKVRDEVEKERKSDNTKKIHIEIPVSESEEKRDIDKITIENIDSTIISDLEDKNEEQKERRKILNYLDDEIDKIQKQEHIQEYSKKRALVMKDPITDTFNNRWNNYNAKVNIRMGLRALRRRIKFDIRKIDSIKSKARKLSLTGISHADEMKFNILTNISGYIHHRTQQLDDMFVDPNWELWLREHWEIVGPSVPAIREYIEEDKTRFLLRWSDNVDSKEAWKNADQILESYDAKAKKILNEFDMVRNKILEESGEKFRAIVEEGKELKVIMDQMDDNQKEEFIKASWEEVPNKLKGYLIDMLNSPNTRSTNQLNQLYDEMNNEFEPPKETLRFKIIKNFSMPMVNLESNLIERRRNLALSVIDYLERRHNSSKPADNISDSKWEIKSKYFQTKREDIEYQTQNIKDFLKKSKERLEILSSIEQYKYLERRSYLFWTRAQAISSVNRITAFVDRNSDKLVLYRKARIAYHRLFYYYDGPVKKHWVDYWRSRVVPIFKMPRTYYTFPPRLPVLPHKKARAALTFNETWEKANKENQYHLVRADIKLPGLIKPAFEDEMREKAEKQWQANLDSSLQYLYRTIKKSYDFITFNTPSTAREYDLRDARLNTEAIPMYYNLVDEAKNYEAEKLRKHYKWVSDGLFNWTKERERELASRFNEDDVKELKDWVDYYTTDLDKKIKKAKKELAENEVWKEKVKSQQIAESVLFGACDVYKQKDITKLRHQKKRIRYLTRNEYEFLKIRNMLISQILKKKKPQTITNEAIKPVESPLDEAQRTEPKQEGLTMVSRLLSKVQGGLVGLVKRQFSPRRSAKINELIKERIPYFDADVYKGQMKKVIGNYVRHYVTANPEGLKGLPKDVIESVRQLKEKRLENGVTSVFSYTNRPEVSIFGAFRASNGDIMVQLHFGAKAIYYLNIPGRQNQHYEIAPRVVIAMVLVAIDKHQNFKTKSMKVTFQVPKPVKRMEKEKRRDQVIRDYEVKKQEEEEARNERRKSDPFGE